MSDFRVDGDLTADVTGFVRSMRDARASVRELRDEIADLDRELRSLDDTTVNVRVVVDGADEIRRLRDDLDRLSRDSVNIRVTVDLDAATVDELRADLRYLRDTGDFTVSVRVDVDGHDDVRRLLATLIVLTSRRWTIDIDLDGVTGALTQLAALRVGLTGVQGAADGAAGGMSGAGGAAGGMIGPILTLLPLLVALTGVAAGVGAGIFGAMATAGLGVGAFALFAIPTFKKISEAAGKGEEAIAKLPKPMQVAARNLIDLKNRFEELQKEIQPVALEVFAEALNVARAGMEGIAPVAKPAGEAIRDLLANMAEGLKGDDWVKFFNYLRDNVGWFIRVWGTAVGNFITGIANMIRAFDPLSKFVSKGFLGMSESFLKWSQNLENNKQFQEFVRFVVTNGPVVMKAIGDIVVVLFKLAVAMAPIGAEMLGFVARVLELVAGFVKANPEIAKFLAIVIPLAGVVALLGPMLFSLAGAIAGLSGPAALVIAAIAGIILVITTWWAQCESFREFIKDMWQRIGATFSLWIGQIKDMIADWLPAIVALWNKYGQSIMDYVKGLWIIISGVVSGALRTIRGIINIVLGLLTGDWKRVWNGMKQMLSGALVTILSILRGGGQVMMGIFRGIVTGIGNIFKGVGNLLWNAGKAIVNGLRNGIGSAWGGLQSWFKGKLNGLRDMLPFSPAKVGPFAGRGYTTFSGAALVDGLRKGALSRFPALRASMIENLSGLKAGLSANMTTSVQPKMSGLQTAVNAGSTGGSKIINFHEGAFKVYNPSAETASDSSTKTLQKVGRFGIFEN